jgi:hypothetical protein
MSPRIILAAVLGISVLLPSAAFAQTSPGPGGGTPGTTGTNGGSMGSGSVGGTHGTSGTPSGTMNSQLQKNHSATTPSPYMGAGKGAPPSSTGMGNGGVQTAPNSSGQGSGASKSGY